MSPTEYKKNSKQFHILSDELEGYLKTLQGLFLDSQLGFRLIEQTLEQRQDFLEKLNPDEDIFSESYQDQTIFSHEQMSGEYMPSSGLFFHQKGEVKDRIKKGGSNEHHIVSIAIIALYEFWEHYLRENISQAYEEPNYQHDLWGDLRLLRNVLVHKNQNTIDHYNEGVRGEFFKVLDVQESFTLTPDIFRGILMLAYDYKNYIFSESLPKTTIRLPRIGE